MLTSKLERQYIMNNEIDEFEDMPIMGLYEMLQTWFED